MSIVDTQGNPTDGIVLNDLVWRPNPGWAPLPWAPGYQGTSTITVSTTTNSSSGAYDTDKDAIEDLFPLEDEIRVETAPQGSSTYFQGPPRYSSSCPPGQHEFELVAENAMGTILGSRDRLVLYCHKCGTTVRHDISAPQDESDDESLQDD